VVWSFSIKLATAPDRPVVVLQVKTVEGPNMGVFLLLNKVTKLYHIRRKAYFFYQPVPIEMTRTGGHFLGRAVIIHTWTAERDSMHGP
jgi:hypothetical protein